VDTVFNFFLKIPKLHWLQHPQILSPFGTTRLPYSDQRAADRFEVEAHARKQIMCGWVLFGSKGVASAPAHLFVATNEFERMRWAEFIFLRVVAGWRGRVQVRY
jgi:hypothetical protein